jgi:hypothetical protein
MSIRRSGLIFMYLGEIASMGKVNLEQLKPARLQLDWPAIHAGFQRFPVPEQSGMTPAQCGDPEISIRACHRKQ